MLHALSTNPALMATMAYETLLFTNVEAAVAGGAEIYSLPDVPRDLDPHTLAIYAALSDKSHILTALIEKHGVSADYLIPNRDLAAGPFECGRDLDP